MMIESALFRLGVLGLVGEDGEDFFEKGLTVCVETVVWVDETVIAVHINLVSFFFRDTRC